jgi:hypothetical protein
LARTFSFFKLLIIGIPAPVEGEDAISKYPEIE